MREVFVLVVMPIILAFSLRWIRTGMAAVRFGERNCCCTDKNSQRARNY